MVPKSRAASAVRSSVTVPMSIMPYKIVEKLSSHRDQVKLCHFKPCGFQAFEALKRTKGASSLAGVGCGDIPFAVRNNENWPEQQRHRLLHYPQSQHGFKVITQVKPAPVPDSD